MNSVLLKANVKDFIGQLDSDSVLRLADMSVSYQNAMKNGDPERLKGVYEGLLGYVKEQEENTGIQILDSPDESYIFAVNALSGMFQRIHDKQEEQMMPEKKKIQFDSIVDADIWLHNNPTVEVDQLDVATDTSWGYFANHSYVKSVTLFYTDYKRPTGYIYGVCEEEHSRHYFASTIEEYIAKWQIDNPNRELISYRSVKNSRGESGSLFWGIGVSENTSLFVLYRRKV